MVSTLSVSMFFHDLVPSQVLMHGLRTTKETIQPNNKAPRRTLLFGPFVSFVMTVPAERPHNLPFVRDKHVKSFHFMFFY